MSRLAIVRLSLNGVDNLILSLPLCSERLSDLEGTVQTVRAHTCIGAERSGHSLGLAGRLHILTGFASQIMRRWQ